MVTLFLMRCDDHTPYQAGQESSIAYSKCKADIDVMHMDTETLYDKVNSAPNTEGLGGIPGLFGESLSMLHST